MAGWWRQDTLRGFAGAALLAALALPAAAGVPERGPVALTPLFAASHGRAGSRVWLAAERVYTEVGARTRALDGTGRTRVARTILAEAASAGLDPLLLLAMIHVESSFDPRVVSSAGAIGLMQLLGSTMRDVAARTRLESGNPRDPVANVQAGTRYFAGLVRAFDDVELALMAYNAGPGRIRRHVRAGGVPERFRSYPRSVLRELDRLRGTIAPDLGPARGLLASACETRRPAFLPAHAAGAAGAVARAATLARASSILAFASPRGAGPADARLSLLAVTSLLRAADFAVGRHPRRAPRPVVPDRWALAEAFASSGRHRARRGCRPQTRPSTRCAS